MKSEVLTRKRPSKKLDRHALFRKPFQRWPTQALIIEAKSLYALIYAEDVFGVHDLFEYENLCAELTGRGYEMVTAAEFRKRGQP